MADAVKVIDSAIAAFGAEPVGITDRNEIECLKRGEMANVMPPDYKGVDKGDEVYIYTAPPAQLFNTIDETLIEALRLVQCMLDDYRERNYGHAQEWIRHISAKMDDYSEKHSDDAYSVIRAAMLQAGNSPVIPDGWIPVSERMPEESGRYWCYVEEQNSLGKSHYQWNCSWNGEVWSDTALSGRVTHWMPLPAAPQQEVKNG
ncbi:DUF551 domain-containing protein [Salmonella enterica subsp. enterica serovar Heidelberg]|nr:DUF551 domain-containing protein [Salmonella enterica subsp. enterica serovar Heidelberg]EJJ4305020.1 DUF551 domain-containing protein [Salmonella enterica]EBE3883943.1 DUF551 domain-containing protein [Salmonella enterica subsp. enterica serovar Heidelberg]EBF2662771.1 DUF551 domain-containing protein [Salmonella enterica subsp. enterica serovar Heidelberg]EBF8269785.1 DUF551 domain-containing protein [Salmonella enterica subsp. enterica serovar Heidelberg]